jgi:hypothetical protein
MRFKDSDFADLPDEDGVIQKAFNWLEMYSAELQTPEAVSASPAYREALILKETGAAEPALIAMQLASPVLSGLMRGREHMIADLLSPRAAELFARFWEVSNIKGEGGFLAGDEDVQKAVLASDESVRMGLAAVGLQRLESALHRHGHETPDTMIPDEEMAAGDEEEEEGFTPLISVRDFMKVIHEENDVFIRPIAMSAPALAPRFLEAIRRMEEHMADWPPAPDVKEDISFVQAPPAKKSGLKFRN